MIYKNGMEPSDFSYGVHPKRSWLIALCLLLVAGCYADCGNSLQVRGRLLDADSVAIVGAVIGGRAFTNGTETDHAPPLIFDGSENFPPSDADGEFFISFFNYFGRCPAPDFPQPDQLEIIILRDGCEERVTIEINEGTATFIAGTFAHDGLELTDPILVPQCAPRQ